MDAVPTLLVLLVVALLLWRGPLWRPRPLPGVTRDRPLLLGHRGVRGGAGAHRDGRAAAPGMPAENTMAAFRAALDAGLDGLETDVQLTRDGRMVLWHDFTVAGRELAGLDLADVRRAAPDAPELGELLAFVAERPGTLLNVEIKSRGGRSRGLERRVARAVRAAGLADRVLVSSFDPLALARLRLADPGLRVALLCAPDLPRGLRTGRLAGWLHADALHPHVSLLDERLAARARARGLMVNVWTVNDPDDVARAVRLGADGVMADDPAALLRAAGRGGARPS